ncbi:MAG: hypothetical protein Q4B42_06380, partial [Oscillospiraceae bacterium]|nr:hypothetical protein [Oscillospiraceae bacterium]
MSVRKKRRGGFFRPAVFLIRGQAWALLLRCFRAKALRGLLGVLDGGVEDGLLEVPEAALLKA